MISPLESVEQMLKAAQTCGLAERSALLEEMGKRSPEMRQELERRLLAAEAEPGSQEVGRFPPGTVIAKRFTVIRYLARGGMGEVYEVEDGRLQGVHVALKTILPAIAGDAGSVRRFEQEVLFARRATHPNLCPIYDIERSEEHGYSFLFLTMKLLRGETLASRLQRGGSIPRGEAMAIFRQMTAGVAALHAAGVIHRDIKPNNVMLDDSGPELCVSIMDFGLARLHSADETQVTQTLAAGTPGYLAPEILLGHGPSQATDLFALGVLLHEVATGERPRMTPALMATETSASLETADLPPLYLRAVKDLLSSDPQRRYAAFEEMKSAADGRASSALTGSLKGGLTRESAELAGASVSKRLRVLVGGVCGLLLLMSLLLIPAVGERVRGLLFSSSQKHIAVLPLELVGGTPETQAIGDGLMDSLAGRLSNLDSGVNTLWVVPASEVRDRKVTTAGAALREFGATIVVRGTFERQAEQARLRLTLIDSKKMREIGFVDLDSKTGDLAALQDEAVVRLGRLMNVSARGDTKDAGGVTPKRAAYEDYLAGLGYYQRHDKPGNLDRSIASLQSALQTDPHFALGFALLTQAYLMKYRLDSDPKWIRDADESSRKAAELGGQLPAAFVALAQFHQLTGKRDLAIQEFQRALDLDPRNADAVRGVARLYSSQGKNQEAEAAYIRATALNPEDWQGFNNLGMFYDNIGRPQQAIESYQHAIELAPDNSWPYTNLGLAYQDLADPKKYKDAEGAFTRSIEIDPTFSAYSDLGMLYVQEHRLPEAVAANLKAIELNDGSAEVWTNLAGAYEWMGVRNKAREARKRAVELWSRRLKVNKEDSQAQASLAFLYAKDGMTEPALEAIRISLALSPGDQYVLSQVADAYELLGRRKEAVRYLKVALAHGLSREQLESDQEIQALLSDPVSRAQVLSSHKSN